MIARELAKPRQPSRARATRRRLTAIGRRTYTAKRTVRRMVRCMDDTGTETRRVELMLDATSIDWIDSAANSLAARTGLRVSRAWVVERLCAEARAAAWTPDLSTTPGAQ